MSGKKKLFPETMLRSNKILRLCNKSKCKPLLVQLLYTMNTLHFHLSYGGWSCCCVVANALNCDIVLSEFELHSRYCVHFQTNYSREFTYPTPEMG